MNNNQFRFSDQSTNSNTFEHDLDAFDIFAKIKKSPSKQKFLTNESKYDPYMHLDVVNQPLIYERFYGEQAFKEMPEVQSKILDFTAKGLADYKIVYHNRRNFANKRTRTHNEQFKTIHKKDEAHYDPFTVKKSKKEN